LNEGNEHISNNQANILIKLCVHPNIISKSTKKHGSKGLSRVITWLSYKRNVISGIIEIKRPSIEEHYLYRQSNSTTFATILYKPLVINNLFN